MKLKLNTSLAGYEAGRTIEIACDSEGVPLNKFWRRRLKDATIDNCVSIITERKKTTKEKK